MIRKIIHIDEEQCTGCGLCANACHEGAITIINGKAKLLRDDFCDGFGDCLPECPVDAISFTEREAAAYDEAAVLRHKQATKAAVVGQQVVPTAQIQRTAQAIIQDFPTASPLRTWPIQLKLVSPFAPYFDACDLLVAADCTAYAYGSFNGDFIKDRVTIIGCPKLDAIDYTDKLCQILKSNNIRTITVTRMTVPCCGGLERAVRSAAEMSGKSIPMKVITIHTDGTII